MIFYSKHCVGGEAAPDVDLHKSRWNFLFGHRAIKVYLPKKTQLTRNADHNGTTFMCRVDSSPLKGEVKSN